MNTETANTVTVSQLIEADNAVRMEHALAAMGVDAQTRHRAEKNLETAKARFWTLVKQANEKTLDEFSKAR